MLMKSLLIFRNDDVSRMSPISPSFFAWLRGREWLMLLKHWHGRGRQRRALTNLDDDLLADIGITRQDVRHEISKPFWK